MELLKKLVSAFGPSGNEDEVAEIIINEIEGFVDSVKRDRLGNVIAFKKGAGAGRIMTTAHMDQIGIMVTAVEKDGFIRFTNVGYVDPFVSIGHNVIFKNGTVGTVAKEQKCEIKNLKLSNLYIDIGASSKEEAQKRVNVGDFAVFESKFEVLGDRISSGALDDRIGCYTLIEAIKRIKNPQSDIYFVFTVQEETYISGAVTSAYSIEPESAIVVDVTGTGDTPESNLMAVKLGDGCAVKVMDSLLICHPRMREYLASTAKENNIKYQLEVLTMGGTDGAEIHTSRTGVITGVISIPSRYIHSPQEMVDMKDVEGAVNLLTKALEQYK